MMLLCIGGTTGTRTRIAYWVTVAPPSKRVILEAAKPKVDDILELAKQKYLANEDCADCFK